MAVFHLPQETPKTHKASLLQNSCCGSRGGRFTVVWAENHGYHWDTRGTTWGHHGGIRCNLPFYWYIDVQYIVYSGDIRISNWSTGYELWVCLKLCKKKQFQPLRGKGWSSIKSGCRSQMVECQLLFQWDQLKQAYPLPFDVQISPENQLKSPSWTPEPLLQGKSDQIWRRPLEPSASKESKRCLTLEAYFQKLAFLDVCTSLSGFLLLQFADRNGILSATRPEEVWYQSYHNIKHRRSSPWIWLTQRKKAFEFVKDC
jgi:hypothetical protein